MNRWYAVHTQVHGEQRAKENLERQGFRVWLPLYWKTRRHARRRDTVLRPLFPRYLFISLDLETQRWRSVFSTRGVSTLLTVDGAPLAVPEGTVEGLQAGADSDGHFTIRPKALAPGETVRIAEGPFAELEAVFQEEHDGNRVLVLLELLGRKTAVRLPGTHIERV